MTHDSLVRIVIWLRVEELRNRGFTHIRGMEFLSSPNHPEWLWNSLNLLFIRYLRLFS
jgi:hypothetical protein